MDDDSQVFDSGDDACYRELRRLMLRVAQGQHLLVLADVDRLLHSDFLARAAAPMDVEEWREMIERSAFAADIDEREAEPGAPPTRPFALLCAEASSSRTAAFVLRPLEVGAWAEQPLRLLLENDRDWLLLESMARAFTVSQVEDAFLRGWLLRDGRGGAGEVLTALRARARLDRLFAFVDSDRASPGALPAATATDIERECARAPVVPCHLTERREKENYIPRRLLAKRAHAVRRRRGQAFRARLAEWGRLSVEERHYDDVRARFGDAVTDAALNDMRACDVTWLREAGEPEMRDVLRSLEDWL